MCPGPNQSFARFVLGRLGLVVAGFVLIPFALLAGGRAAASESRVEVAPADVLAGPWRWLPSEIEDIRPATGLQIGPWREVAVTRDAPRRAAILKRLDAIRDVPASRAEAPSKATSLRRGALESARLLEAAGRFAAAAEAYASVVDSHDVALIDVWHGLAANLARSGHSEAAERAFLHGLDASGRASDQIRFRYDLARFYAAQGRLLESLAVLDALAPHVPGSATLADARSRLRSAIELTGASRPGDGQVAWPTPPRDPGWADFDPRLVEVIQRLPQSVQDELLPWARRIREDEGLRMVVLGLAGGLILLAFFVLMRQRGDVTVSIEYPDELRGLFCVRIGGGRRAARSDALSESQIREGGASTRRKHYMVSRETRFQRFFTGRYQVTIDGLLIDPESDEVLGRVHEVKVVRIRHRRTVRLEFDVHPSSCPIDIRVVWGDRPADEAQITVPGSIDKPRLATRGAIRILLPKGSHRLLIGCGDRVFDQALAVSSFRPTAIVLDVLATEAVFKGCPPAVIPYLTGDLLAAARALERDDQAALGFRLLAKKHQAEGDKARAADFFESAGDPRAAAKLRLELRETDRAAALFEEAEDWIDAAEAYRLDGQILRAGECYERISGLLQDESLRRNMGQRALSLVEENRGATEKIVVKILQFL